MKITFEGTDLASIVEQVDEFQADLHHLVMADPPVSRDTTTMADVEEAAAEVEIGLPSLRDLEAIGVQDLLHAGLDQGLGVHLGMDGRVLARAERDHIAHGLLGLR